MKKFCAFLLFTLTSLSSVTMFAQQVNLDSITTALTTHRSHMADARLVNKDSLFRSFQAARPGRERIRLIYKIYDLYANTKKNTEDGYRMLSWARAHHDQISAAVIASEMGTVLYSTGDKAAASQLETEALEAALQSGDKQALGIVYQNSFARADFKSLQMKDYGLKALKLSMAVQDTLHISWEYIDLGWHYANIYRPDSAEHYYGKALEWAVRANSVFDVCSILGTLSGFQNESVLKERYLKTALKIAELTETRSAVCIAATSLGNYHAERNNIDSALAYGVKAYRAALPLTFNFKIDPAQLLSKAYLKKRDIDSTVKYIMIHDSLRLQSENAAGAIQAQARDFSQKQAQEAQKHTQQLWLLGVTISVLLLIAGIFWRNNRQSRKANALLLQQKQRTEMALNELKAAQTQLIHSEKMASLGELTAGIAHEIQNPLNFVNNFSEVSRELMEELKEELDKGDLAEAKAISADVIGNLEKINHHGKRADGIVKGMLEHSRASAGQKELTDINKLTEEYLRLAYHGLRAKDKSFNAELITDLKTGIPPVRVVPQDIGRVLLNVFNNAFYAVAEKARTAGSDYRPELTVTTWASDYLQISIRDNGTGIPEEMQQKIMQPFFTTKPTGKGTGLGLSLSYDIVVKGHGGSIAANSKLAEFTEIIITLPLG